ncbi:Acetyltransferase [Vibrio chagasii]|nr:Acetyltransferase [Vibrio chagasii]CAH6965133.1 Acetyltransferase [Vibrio chagasii]CAH7172760.1 Acetyltransferase [Vibrio chagasii]CAH7208359.1 Acetyltransferase [Vibrio chagasii]CAH7397624.1 Acetyltransferase [Vibrio chagasii]
MDICDIRKELKVPFRLNRDSEFIMILGNTLVVGAGPAGIQTSQILAPFSQKIALISKSSHQWENRKRLMRQHGNVASCEVSKPQLAPLVGLIRFDELYTDLSPLPSSWDTLVLATPAHAYCDVLASFSELCLKNLKQIILMSSMIGGCLILKGILKKKKVSPNIILFSSYFATSHFSSNPTTQHPLTVTTKTVKKRVYIYLSEPNDVLFNALRNALEKVNVQVVLFDNPFSVEGRNTAAYVHPAFLINTFSLDHILSNEDDTKYMYKLYPEGPITMKLIKELLHHWKSISRLLEHYSAEPINLLQLLNDENLPVLEATIPKDKIDSFNELNEIEQEYLLYVRYSTILIDPNSESNTKKSTFEVSAKPYLKGKVRKGRLQLPRTPLEDLQTLYWLNHLVQQSSLISSISFQSIEVFESWVKERNLPTTLIQALKQRASEYYVHATPSLSQ